MKLGNLAEGIILQSIEDLWNDEHKQESLAFFQGDDFLTCAALAGMNLLEQAKLLQMVSQASGNISCSAPNRHQLYQKDGKRRSGYKRELALAVR
ncbi:MAG: hypothetical protein HZB33_02390 [Nitrospirae bacterium]|nr:hypothetical protein [Nitrospirota bacterium]